MSSINLTLRPRRVTAPLPIDCGIAKCRALAPLCQSASLIDDVLVQLAPLSQSASLIDDVLVQEALDGDLLVFSPYPSLSKFLRDSGLVAHAKACEVAW